MNHFPIIGTLVGLGLLLIFHSLEKMATSGARASIIFAAMALVAIPTFFSGPGAQGAIKKLPGVSEALIERHQGAAMLALLFMEITGGLSLAALWQSQGVSRPARWNWSMSAVLLFSIVTVGLIAESETRAATFAIPEIASRKNGVAEELMVSKIVSF